APSPARASPARAPPSPSAFPRTRTPDLRRPGAVGFAYRRNQGTQTWSSSNSWLLDLQHFHLEDQVRVGRNQVAGAASAVGEFRRDHSLADAADLHAGHAEVPALDPFARAQREDERLAAILAAIELLAVLERAGVVDLNRVARLGSRPCAFLQVLVL